MSKISRWIKDPFCGLSHLAGTLLAIAALVVLLILADGRPWHTTGFAIYGGSLILLYAASAACHSVHCAPAKADRLDRFDHAAIFLLIAGTYTPLCLVPLRGVWGWSLLGIEWALAATGIVLIGFNLVRSEWVRVVVYVLMGWMALIFLGPLARVLPAAAIGWLLAGGLVYTVGAVIYALDRPHLWPGKFTAHDLWHVLVLAGSACHFVALLVFIALP